MEVEEQRMSIQEFIEKHGITMEAQRLNRRTDVAQQNPEQVAWSCTFKCGDKEATFEFSHGTGWTPNRTLTSKERMARRSDMFAPDSYHGERKRLEELAMRGKLNAWGKARLTQFFYPKPRAEDVLPSLMMDAQTYFNARDALDIAEEFDMRAGEARRMWRALESGVDKLGDLLGGMVLKELVEEVEED